MKRKNVYQKSNTLFHNIIRLSKNITTKIDHIYIHICIVDELLAIYIQNMIPKDFNRTYTFF